MPALLVAVPGLELQHRFAAVGRVGHRVEDPVLGGDEGGQLGQDHARHRGQVALALEHPGEALPVGLQPVLLDVLPGRLPEVADHLVQLVLQDGNLAAGLDPDLPGEVAFGHGGGHLGDGPDLVGQIGRQLVDVVGQVLPDAADFLRLRLAAQLAFDPDLAGDSGDLAGERVELVDHGIDGVLQLEELAFDVDGDLLAQVAIGHRGGHLGDVSHLTGQVAGHQVDVVGQLLPDPADLDGHGGRLTELALGPDLAGDPGQLGHKPVELVDHGVDGVLQIQHLAPDVGRDLLAQVAVGDGTDDSLHLAGRPDQGVDQAVDRFDAPRPALGPAPEHHPLRQLALLAHHPAHPGQLRPERLVGDDDLVEAIRHLAGHAGPFQGHPGGEIAALDLGEDTEQDLGIHRVGQGHHWIRH